MMSSPHARDCAHGQSSIHRARRCEERCRRYSEFHGRARSIISIFGESLAPVLEIGRVNPLAQSIAGVTVTVSDRILPLLYVSPTQINAQVPSDLGDGDYTLQVHNNGPG